MSYIVRQNIKGKIYLYEATSYWDKEKKQCRQKRKYLGREDAEEKTKVKQIKSKKANLSSYNYGNSLILDKISDKLEITKLLQSIFPKDYLKILSLAYYDICESSPYYMFQYWQDEQYFPKLQKLYSSTISNLCDNLGRDERSRLDFIDNWSKYINPKSGIYYDITSISSYGTNIDFLEWGYNRDKEKLPQINLGMMCCQDSKLPLFYNIYPGSIVDVSTLQNCITYLGILNLKDVTLILDRGFCSKANLLQMHKNGLKFIQPLSFTLKNARELIKKNKKKLSSNSSIFKYNEELLHHVIDKIKIEDKEFNVHIFFNEIMYTQQKTRFLSALLDIENNVIKNATFDNIKEYSDFKKVNIATKYQQYFKWNRKTHHIEINNRKVSLYLTRIGYFIMAENYNADKNDILSSYRGRDHIEKLFDTEKNDMNIKRLRTHDKYTNYGRLFIKFIALILHTEISNFMKKGELFKQYSLKEMMAEMKKVKIHTQNGQHYLSEISKKQKFIFKIFDIDVDEVKKKLSKEHVINSI